MKNKLNKIKEEALIEIGKASNEVVLENAFKKYLGRKGELTDVLRNISDLTIEEKKEIGKMANDVKVAIREKFSEKSELILAQTGETNTVDVTLPNKKIERGHIHPITQTLYELEDLFASLGFASLDGPELESDFFNFETLNVPPHHPARDMQDTFYVNSDNDHDLLMRTQTSPMQVRAMLEFGAPLKVIIPGRCFRNEATDVRHEHTFYQLEGLMVGENLNFGHLKGVLSVVGKKLYGENTKMRMRPKFYPFVEPGSNGEYTCFLCEGKGCRLCKHTGWLEVIGCGMVHPNVLRAGGVDPKKYQGFAFGFGLNRLVMLKHGIEDIRLFNSGDLRFLNQF